MRKIAVIGDKYSILGFKAMGFHVCPAEEGPEAEAALHLLAREGYAVIYITEQAAEQIGAAMESYSARRYPAVIPIPGNQGTLGIGRDGIKKSVERAIGADILFRDG